MTHVEPVLTGPGDATIWRAWADGLLAPLDLSVRLLHQVAEAGQRRWDAASPLAPKITAGTDRWSAMVVALRTLTGWRADEEGGLPRTVHPSESFYVVVRTGAGDLGKIDPVECPTTKNPLGPTLRRIIDGVPGPVPLFDFGLAPVDPEGYREPTLWLFLSDYRDGMLRSELSQPSRREGDVITAYARRIPLPPIPLDDSAVDLPAGDSAGPDLDIQPLL